MNPFVTSNNEFALELYKCIAKEKEGNLFFSPFSIQIANAMLYAGANGKTADSIAKASCFDVQGEALHQAFQENLDRLNSLSKGVELAISAELWVQVGYPIKDAYRELLAARYHAACEALNFKDDPEGARLTMNGMVKTQTRGKIEELFTQGSLDSSTRAVLTDAIYFQGPWRYPFCERMTKQDRFYPKSGEPIYVPTMHQKEMQVRFYRDGSVQMVELPYGEQGLHMLLVGDPNSSDLSNLEANLSVWKLNHLVTGMGKEEVDVYLPKFEATSEYSLKGLLSQLGMGVAFGADADWSGITEAEQLVLSDIVHKAVVRVDEKETVVVAATGANLGYLSITPRFDGRRPFVYFIRDEQETILFIGRVENPLKK